MLYSVDRAASTYLLVAIVEEVGSVTQPGQEMTFNERDIAMSWPCLLWCQYELPSLECLRNEF